MALTQTDINYLLKPLTEEERNYLAGTGPQPARHAAKIEGRRRQSLPAKRDKLIRGEKVYLGDGGQLWLEFNAPQQAYWYFRFEDKAGKWRWFYIGAYNDWSLKDARAEAYNLRHGLEQGIDPRDAKAKRAALAEVIGKTLADCWTEFRKLRIEQRDLGNLTDSRIAAHDQFWATYIVCEPISKRRVADIVESDVVALLKPIYHSRWRDPRPARPRAGHHPAVGPLRGEQLRWLLERLFDIAIRKEWRTAGNPALWEKLKADIGELPEEEERHWEALASYTDAPHFRQRLHTVPSVWPEPRLLSLLVEVVILLGARSGEIRNARWGWINWTEETITIPARFMKRKKKNKRKPFTRPLVPRVIEIFKELGGPDSNPNDLIFPCSLVKLTGSSGDTPATRRLDPPRPFNRHEALGRVQECATGVTLHGFRSTFREWAHNQKGISFETAETFLAHEIKTVEAGNTLVPVSPEVVKAYLRKDLANRRRVGLRWAKFWCSEPTGKNTLPPLKVRKPTFKSQAGKMLAMLQDGKKVDDIARELGCSPGTVYLCLTPHVALRTKFALQADRNAEIVDAFVAGKKPKDLAVRHGVGEERLRKILRLGGQTPRNERKARATARLERIIALFKAGLDPEDIAAEIGVTQPYLERLLREHGQSAASRRQTEKQERNAKILARWSAGQSIASIAGEFRLSPGTVYGILYGAGQSPAAKRRADKLAGAFAIS